MAIPNPGNTVEVNLLYPGAASFLKSRGRGSDQLAIFRQKDGKWFRADFSPGKTIIRIGSSSEKNDIAIEGDDNVDSIHAVISYLGDKFIIVERGKNPNMTVNGIKTPFSILEDTRPALVVIGRTALILKSKRCAKNSGIAGENSFLAKDSHGVETRCDLARPQTFGNSGSCDIVLKSEGHPEDFIGMTVPVGNHIYLFPFSNIRINGEEASRMKLNPLPAMAQLSPCGLSFSLPPARAGQKGAGIPAFSAKAMQFVEVQEDESLEGLKMSLPKAGKSFMISRMNDEGCFFVKSQLVSRKHAQVIVYDSSILVEDCYSANGTFVNAEKISRRSVHPGDFLSVGDKTFLLGYSLKEGSEPV